MFNDKPQNNENNETKKVLVNKLNQTVQKMTITQETPFLLRDGKTITFPIPTKEQEEEFKKQKIDVNSVTHRVNFGGKDQQKIKKQHTYNIPEEDRIFILSDPENDVTDYLANLSGMGIISLSANKPDGIEGQDYIEVDFCPIIKRNYQENLSETNGSKEVFKLLNISDTEKEETLQKLHKQYEEKINTLASFNDVEKYNKKIYVKLNKNFKSLVVNCGDLTSIRCNLGFNRMFNDDPNMILNTNAMFKINDWLNQQMPKNHITLLGNHELMLDYITKGDEQKIVNRLNDNNNKNMSFMVKNNQGQIITFSHTGEIPQHLIDNFKKSEETEFLEKIDDKNINDILDCYNKNAINPNLYNQYLTRLFARNEDYHNGEPVALQSVRNWESPQNLNHFRRKVDYGINFHGHNYIRNNNIDSYKNLNADKGYFDVNRSTQHYFMIDKNNLSKVYACDNGGVVSITYTEVGTPEQNKKTEMDIMKYKNIKIENKVLKDIKDIKNNQENNNILPAQQNEINEINNNILQIEKKNIEKNNDYQNNNLMNDNNIIQNNNTMQNNTLNNFNEDNLMKNNLPNQPINNNTNIINNNYIDNNLINHNINNTMNNLQQNYNNDDEIIEQEAKQLLEETNKVVDVINNGNQQQLNNVTNELKNKYNKTNNQQNNNTINKNNMNNKNLTLKQNKEKNINQQPHNIKQKLKPTQNNQTKQKKQKEKQSKIQFKQQINNKNNIFNNGKQQGIINEERQIINNISDDSQIQQNNHDNHNINNEQSNNDNKKFNIGGHLHNQKPNNNIAMPQQQQINKKKQNPQNNNKNKIILPKPSKHNINNSQNNNDNSNSTLDDSLKDYQSTLDESFNENKDSNSWSKQKKILFITVSILFPIVGTILFLIIDAVMSKKNNDTIQKYSKQQPIVNVSQYNTPTKTTNKQSIQQEKQISTILSNLNSITNAKYKNNEL